MAIVTYIVNRQWGGKKLPWVFRLLPSKLKYRYLARHGALFHANQNAQMEMESALSQLLWGDEVDSIFRLRVHGDDDRTKEFPVPEAILKKQKKIFELYDILGKRYFFCGSWPQKEKLISKMFNRIQKFLLDYGNYIRKQAYHIHYQEYLEKETKWYQETFDDPHRVRGFYFGDLGVTRCLNDKEVQQAMRPHKNDPMYKNTFYFNIESWNKHVPPLGIADVVKCREIL